MNVYKKLMIARTELQRLKLSKSGNNKFAGYQYFELGDFLPAVQTIFDHIGLCGVVSFTPDTATLRIFDIDKPENSPIVFTSPMGSAALKGCHEVQNIGAVETYQRRYLWVTAMEIVEHDALDAVTGAEKERNVVQMSPPKAAPTVSKKQIEDLRNAMKVAGVNEADFLAMAKIDSLESLTQDRLNGAKNWIKRQGEGNANTAS